MLHGTQRVARTARWALRCLSLILVVTACCTAEVRGSQEAPAPAAPPAEIDTAQLSARIAELAAQEAAGSLPAEAVQELTLLRETEAFLEQAAAARASADRSSAQARSAPEQLAQIDAFLAKATDELLAEIDPTLTLDALNTQLEAARVRRQTEQELRAKVDADQESRKKRRAEIPSERGLATERLDALVAALATEANPEETAELTQARRRHAQAEHALRRATLRALDAELAGYDARRSLIEKRRVYHDRRAAVEAENAAALQEIISAKQVEAAEAAQRDAAAQRRNAAKAHPLVKSILERNQELTARNTEVLGLNGDDALAKTEADDQLVEWRSAFGRSEARVGRVGLTNAIGQHLRGQRQRLPDVNAIKREMRDRGQRIGMLVNEAEDLSLEVATLVDLDDAAEKALADETGELPAPGSPEREEIRLAARDALRQQSEYASTLNSSINTYLDDTLLELQSTQRELHRLIVEYTNFIDERILWTRSAAVLQGADFRASEEAAGWILDAPSWLAIGTHLRDDFNANVLLYTLCIPVLVILVVVQRGLRRRLHRVGEGTKRYTTDRFALTVEALVVTLLIAVVAPAWMGFIAWRLSTMESGWGVGLSSGLSHAAAPLFLFELIRVLCRFDGVAILHFRMKPVAVQAVRRHLRWLALIVVPLSFVVGATQPNDNHHDSLGRLAFIAAMLTLAVFVQRLARPSGVLVRTILARHAGGWLDRLGYVWYLLMVLAPIATAIIAALGYFYSAIQLQHRVVDTAWLVLAVLVGRASLLRALFLAQRRLDMEQRKKKRALAESEAAAAATAGTHPIAEAVSDAEVMSVPEVEVDLASLSAQTRKLLSTAVVFTTLVGLALVWRDMLPAVNFFQEITIWTPEATAPVAAMGDAVPAVPGVPGVTGSAAAATAAGAVTLADLVYSLVILLVTALISTNIPGLLEIVLLQRLPISRSGRYAITTIVRYLLVIVGMVMAFGAIGIGWSKVQWLLAAVTVGLGFGLQEIFANFVSGLIILFERPVRVGDTVTVSGITGTVARLRIRATTITDWDRKELIIPNKEFVTGQIVNWSLSDPILRIVIPVGIAYGSNTKLAEELLLQAAKDDPIVLKEPAPTVVFAEFGDSSLNFRLRVFIPHIENLFGTTHRLHNAIDRAFRDAGVVIAFPQRDVHMYPAPPTGGDKG